MAPKQTKPEKYQQIPTQELDDTEASTSENSTLIHDEHRDNEEHEIDAEEIAEPPSHEITPSTSHNSQVDAIEIAVNEQPQTPSSSEAQSASRHDHPAILPVSNDGVFANIPAKPSTESTKTENLPSYEEASRDSAPAYYGNALIAPSGDEYFVEGLPVGNIFSFLWSMLVSMCFQFVGFLLTYLLHTSHASKNGSTAGLGFTLVQFGFYLRTPQVGDIDSEEPQEDGPLHSVWLSYLMMILGWFLIIRSTSEYIRVRKLEAVMLATPEGTV
ncbi:hypothetical protein K493DRAFT_254403 [Basidiobolus meristosporus CBS 931.73]|uniref:Metal homeostatis protein BSD2 n=1 Tax=Basidiobolus meristosporus CBS 931.73 TaxID=1314790 RepID=A0A1Y1YZW3_9FUNG|nr:hypothetical protein K493DRAFT_254403 [Basidiobolus meristosporus CBS 931.73]|eukprot:ORY03095.1 hypothetical protein K493DRAFT_254403 [Basidiobolus meristosporus CBS 931.73]